MQNTDRFVGIVHPLFAIIQINWRFERLVRGGSLVFLGHVRAYGFGQHLQRDWNRPFVRGQAGFFRSKDHVGMNVFDAGEPSSSGFIARLQWLLYERLADICDQVRRNSAILMPAVPRK